MKLRIVSAPMVMALALVATPALFASPLSVHVPVQAKFGKTKQVSINLRNASGSAVRVMAGASEITLAPGSVTPAKVTVGEKIVTEDGTATMPAGTVLATATSDLGDATITVH